MCLFIVLYVRACLSACVHDCLSLCITLSPGDGRAQQGKPQTGALDSETGREEYQMRAVNQQLRSKLQALIQIVLSVSTRTCVFNFLVCLPFSQLPLCLFVSVSLLAIRLYSGLPFSFLDSGCVLLLLASGPA